MALTIPLLNGLMKQDGNGLAVSIVDEALNHAEAIETLKRFGRSISRRIASHGVQANYGNPQRSTSKEKLTACSEVEMMTTNRKRSLQDLLYSNFDPPTVVGRSSGNAVLEHWLWKSIRSYSSAERTGAAKILLMSIKSPDNPDVGLVDVITRQRSCRISKQMIKLFNRVIIRRYTEYTVVGDPFSFTSRLAVEWVAILEHLWTSQRYLNFENSHQFASASITVAKENWAWLTRSIWLCACRVHQQRLSSPLSAISSTITLAALSRLAEILSIHREFPLKSQSASTGRCAFESESKLSITSRKNNRISFRQRSNSNSSNRSGQTNTKATCSNSRNVVSQCMMHLIAFNTKLLWSFSERSCIDDLSPLACLIGAYLLSHECTADDQFGSPTVSSHQQLKGKENCFNSPPTIWAIGGVTNGTLALNQASRSLENLVSPVKQCKVTVVCEPENMDKEKDNEKEFIERIDRQRTDIERIKGADLAVCSDKKKRLVHSQPRQKSTYSESIHTSCDNVDSEEAFDDNDDYAVGQEALKGIIEKQEHQNTESDSVHSESSKLETSSLHTKENSGKDELNCNQILDENKGLGCRVDNNIADSHSDDKENNDDSNADDLSHEEDEDDDFESIEGDDNYGNDDNDDVDIDDGCTDDEYTLAQMDEMKCVEYKSIDLQETHDVDNDIEEGEEEEEEDDDDDDMEDDDIVDEMDMDDLSAAVENAYSNLRHSRKLSEESDTGSSTTNCLSPSLQERNIMFLKASMQVLMLSYPLVTQPKKFDLEQTRAFSDCWCPRLSVKSENFLVGTINEIVKPRKKALNIKIILRRAPTQEEFFRGSLSRNPVSLSSLIPAMTEKRVSANNCSDDEVEPTISDLRQYIANDLQMADSAELIEIIVANKIVNVNVKLRVVYQVLWKNHLSDNAGLSSGTTNGSLFNPSNSNYFASAGSAVSMIFNTSQAVPDREKEKQPNDETCLSSLPPMVVTYRLAGVDGEATEDTVHINDLPDPEAPSTFTTNVELEQRIELEYGSTCIITQGRGVSILLRSIRRNLNDALSKIQRDGVCDVGHSNESLLAFLTCPPCSALTLLKHCAKVASNRKLLLQARSPTVLLTMLLDVLKILEKEKAPSEVFCRSNPTAEILQELIEVLTSDISLSPDVIQASSDNNGTDSEQDVASMHMLLESIETISPSPPLRSIIAKLLPFLTYGQRHLSKELAQHFSDNIKVAELTTCENTSGTVEKRSSILMDTFVQAALGLPSNSVCNTLRTELLNCGLPIRLTHFILEALPAYPPPWSTALYSSVETQKLSDTVVGQIKDEAETAWRAYYGRSGLKTAFKVLTGLCSNHKPTQSKLAESTVFLKACHWIETTSDNKKGSVETNGLGLLAETLLDEMCTGNDDVHDLVVSIRKKTRTRKMELAGSTRKFALKKVAAFQPLLVSNTLSLPASTGYEPALDDLALNLKGEKPAWLTEAEMMEEEYGLTCSVCQEGRTLQPCELLGLYAYVRKVAIPVELCGSRASIEGSTLLKALPVSLPDPLPEAVSSTEAVEGWLREAKEASESVLRISSSSSPVTTSGGRRNSIFTTTVSAGNAIHISCHLKAKQADRSHPKAPKSEWEGATLRNSRCSCNVILPLVSSRSSKVPLVAVDSALTDHQAAVANLLGTNPKSMLWTVLHDARLLLLRMAYGESLNLECGGGSLASNCHLLFYQLLMADMFGQDAQIDQPYVYQHAKGLSAALLIGCTILGCEDNSSNASRDALSRSVADSAPMAALTCVLFHNCKPNYDTVDQSNSEILTPHPLSQWVVGKEYFLRSLIICAGRRHALRIHGSGCQAINRSVKATSFADWDQSNNEVDNHNEYAGEKLDVINESQSETDGILSSSSSQSRHLLEEFQTALRPMLTYFVIMNQLAAEFTVTASDMDIADSAHRLERVINECHRAKSIHELIDFSKIPSLPHDLIITLFQSGMVLAK